MTEPAGPDNRPDHIARNARNGIILFIAYVIFYAGFVALAAFSMEAMRTEILGVNVAILYGLALIVLAFVFALIYMAISDDDPASGGEK